MINQFITDIEEYNSKRLCNSWVGTAIVGGSLLTAGATYLGASKASNAQKDAAAQASAIAQQQYQQTRSDLDPYRTQGINASKELQDRLPFLTSPITMDEATLEQTPGYQFTKSQGLKATQNSAAARGLGVSGAALKGAATFATGLADNTYQNQFNNENINRTNAFNRLKSLIDTGENAAAQTGTFGQATANTSAGAAIGAGNAEAAADNSIANTFGKIGSNVAGYAAYKGLYGNGDVPNNLKLGTA